jgi:hypothetical protein
MAKVVLSLACGHEVERTLPAERVPQMQGVHVACTRCHRLQPVARFSEPTGVSDTE